MLPFFSGTLGSSASFFFLVNASLLLLLVPVEAIAAPQPQVCAQIPWSDQEELGKALDLNFPTIAINMSRHWALTEKVADINGLRDLYPKHEVFEVSLTNDGSFYGSRAAENSPIGKARHRPASITLRWDHFLDALLGKRASKNAYGENFNDPPPEIGKVHLGVIPDTYIWYQNGQTSAMIREALLPLVDEPAKLMEKEALSFFIWLSAGGTTSNLHYDPSENWICQVMGEKELTMFAPEDVDKMYPVSFEDPNFELDIQQLLQADGSLTSFPVPQQYKDNKVYAAVDNHAPDFELFPAFKNATPWTCTVRAGSCMFVPQFWWHNIKSFGRIDGVSADFGLNMATNMWFGNPVRKKRPGVMDLMTMSKRLKQALKATRKHLKKKLQRRQPGRSSSGPEL
mmetsp:Transcript_125608/g.250626  ORF Transcript_125608/g.250626 Transcript_125608/m.250626 type:complete len:399 (+) Transcript_125608:40-1236(+)